MYSKEQDKILNYLKYRILTWSGANRKETVTIRNNYSHLWRTGTSVY